MPLISVTCMIPGMSRVEIPRDARLSEFLRLGELSAPLLKALDSVVQVPLSGFLAHEGKALRARAVEAGFRLGGGVPPARACEVIGECIETIHAGSLIVDDIQDAAQVRRGNVALHRAYGISVALNCGNLLYFLGLQRLADAGLSAEQERACGALLNEELARAHYGQALDVGTPMDLIPQQDVAEICLAANRLKSGVLMSLAIVLGAKVAGASAEKIRILDEFGHRLGMGLQMFDDLRNIAPLPVDDPNLPKRLEDLRLRRPSWIWAQAATRCSERDYADFVRATQRLPDDSFLTAWLGLHDFAGRASEAASAFVDEAFAQLERDLPVGEKEQGAVDELRAVTRRFGT